MRNSDEMIRNVIQDFVNRTGQTEVRWAIAYCIGYYGAITKQIWFVIGEMVKEEILTW
jgi:hypothetical protein